MGLKTQSMASEMRAIRSICDGDQEIRARLLAVMQGGHFVTDSGKPSFERILGLLSNNKPIPKVAILQQDPTLTQEVHEILGSSDDRCLTIEETESLIDQLELFRKLRVIYDGASEMLDGMREPSADTVNNALAAMEKTIVRARSSYEDVELVHSGAGSNAAPVIDKVLSQAKPDRIRTGFKRFDEASGGFARKDLVLIAANTGGGKSVMAEQIAHNSYFLDKRNVAIVSFEMDDEEYYARLLSNGTGIEFSKVYLHKLDYTTVKKARAYWESFDKHGEIENCKFTLWCPTIDVTPNQIGAILRPGNYDLIIIDYVGLVAPEKKADLWENLGEITRQFKSVARSNDCVVIVMAQLDEDTNKVKYSKAMRHHSSYVWWWNFDEEAEESKQITVHQDKARHCKRFSFPLVHDFSTMRFGDPPEEEGAPMDISSKEQAARADQENFDPETGELGAADTQDLLSKARERQAEAEKQDQDEKNEGQIAAEEIAAEFREEAQKEVSEQVESEEVERQEKRVYLDKLSRKLSNVFVDLDEDDV